MTDYDRDRGAYSPSGEAPLAFDARKETQGAGRPPFALIISALILLILVLALIFYYRSGVRQAGQPPVVVSVPSPTAYLWIFPSDIGK